MKPKLIRLSTVPISLNYLLKGQLQFLSQYYQVLGVSSKGEDLLEVQKREGILVKEIEIQRKISLFKDVVSLVKLYLLFRKEKPNIVHSITPKAGLLSMLAAKMAGVPVRIHTFTGLVFPSKSGLLQRILILMDRLLCWSATQVIPEGNGVKNDLIQYKITSKPLKVLANGNVNGIDLDFFSTNAISEEDKENAKSLINWQASDFIFVFVGRLVGDKGINELVTAFKKIENPSAKLLLVGPTEEDLDPLKSATLEEIRKNKNIFAVGHQNDVRPFLAISHALAFPSYREGFPNVVMQAGAMGLPAIVSDINGCNEIVIEGKNGLIIPPKNEVALLESMLKILNDKNLYQTLQQNAREAIASRFDQKLVWNAVLNLYQKCLLDLKKT